MLINEEENMAVESIHLDQEIKKIGELTLLQIDESIKDFNKYELQLSNKQITSNEFLLSVISVKISAQAPNLIEMRDKLVKLGLQQQDTNKFLFSRIIIEQGIPIPKQENLLQLLLENGIELEPISARMLGGWFDVLPSLHALELMLNHKFDPIVCLNMLIDSEEPKERVDTTTAGQLGDFTNFEKRQALLVEKILERNTDPNKINVTIMTAYNLMPSLAIYELLLKYKLEPNKLLNMALICHSHDQNLRDSIVKFILDQGADAREIVRINPFSLPSVETCKVLLDKGLEPAKLYALILKNKEHYLEANIDNIQQMDSLLELARSKSDNVTELEVKALDFLEKLKTKGFEPETTNFSKLETIKTWIASKYYGNPKMLRALQHRIASLLPQNPQVKEEHWLDHTICDDDSERSGYGNSWATCAATEAIILQKIHALSKSKPIVVLEIGGGSGCFAWKVPLAFEQADCKFYFNELVQSEIDIAFKVMLPKIFAGLGLPADELLKTITTIKMNCLDLEHYNEGELVGKIDVIVVNNVEHFFTPVGHQKLIAMIDKLLVPGGFSYHTAMAPTAPCSGDLSKSTSKILNESEADKTKLTPYYAWFQYNLGGRLGTPTEIRRPEITAANVEISLSSSVVRTHMYFTPEVYRRAVVSSQLKVEEAFFVDESGTEKTLEVRNWDEPLDKIYKTTAIFSKFKPT